MHSGLTGGGARNPLAELCEAAQSCVDARTGRVTIPWFYDEVIPPTAGEMKQFLSSGFQVDQFKKSLWVPVDSDDKPVGPDSTDLGCPHL